MDHSNAAMRAAYNAYFPPAHAAKALTTAAATTQFTNVGSSFVSTTQFSDVSSAVALAAQLTDVVSTAVLAASAMARSLQGVKAVEVLGLNNQLPLKYSLQPLQATQLVGLARGSEGMRISSPLYGLHTLDPIEQNAAVYSAGLFSRFEGTTSGSSFARLEERNKENAIQLVAEIENESANSAWGSLTRRLTSLIEESESAADGYAAVSPGSLNTLLELVRKASAIRRPAISITRSGNLWLEWVLGLRERLSLELLPASQMRYAWVRPDKRNPNLFARRHATLSIDEFLSEEIAN